MSLGGLQSLCLQPRKTPTSQRMSQTSTVSAVFKYTYGAVSNYERKELYLPDLDSNFQRTVTQAIPNCHQPLLTKLLSITF
jgi:hypothetical protein